MEEIVEVGGTLNLVVTLEDHRESRKSGRVWVDGFCLENRVPLVKVGHINDSGAVEAIRRESLDWLFIIGWSQIAGPEVLGSTRRGVVGMHPTLLPAGRGRAAIPWAILRGLQETGVTMFQLDRGVDTGPIIAQERLPIASGETATTLYERVAKTHRSLIRRTWADFEADRILPVPQDEGLATVWPGRTPEDGLISPEMTVAEADRLVRATTRPYPGAFWAEGNAILRVWSGSPDQSTSLPSVRIPLADGEYFATEYEWEILS
jgi:methionyl-tRNA formyltransferase